MNKNIKGDFQICISVPLTIQVLEIMKLNIFKFRNKILIRQEKELKTITGWALKCEK